MSGSETPDRTLVTPSIVARLAEESAFLWHLRHLAVGEPHYSLTDLARLDDRLEAHLDGLRIAGDAGWEACRANLEVEEPGERFAAATAAFEGGGEERCRIVLAAASVPGGVGAVASALGWLPYDRARGHLEKLFRSPEPLHRQVALAGWAIHRQDPGEPLLAAARDANPGVLARAVRALGELGRADISVLAASRMTHDDADVRFAGAWSAALHGRYPNAVVALQKIATTDPARARRAVDLALRRMDPKAGAAWLTTLPIRLAVIGAGVIGDPALVPGLLDRMRDPVLARVAGEALTMITGVDLAAEGLEGRKPEGFESGPTDNPADPEIGMDPDDNLPWPDRSALEKWCKDRSGSLKAGTRHLVGKPIEAAHLRQVLINGKQRQRAAAALELAILEVGRPLIEVRAPGFRQHPSPAR